MKKFLPATLALLAIVFAMSAHRALAVPVYYTGHADVGVGYEDGELHPHLHFGGNAKAEGGEPIANGEFEPDEALIRVPDIAKVTLPLSGFEFTGAAGGSKIWRLPQTTPPAGIPFLGLATEELDSDDWVGDITIALTSVVSAPVDGYFSLWQDGFVPLVLFDTYDGIGGDDQFDVSVGGHDHFNWGFTTEGVYRLEFTWSGTHVDDGFQTASGVFTFLVGDLTVVPEPSTLMLAGLGLAGIIGWQMRRRRG